MNVVLQPRLIKPQGVYDEMAKISRASYERFLAGQWEYRENWNGDWTELWRSTFHVCRELSAGGHNVFLVGTDTIAVQPVEVFDKYPYLTMFWYTDPPTRAPYSDGYMNSEPMYIPANLSEALWDLGASRIENMQSDGTPQGAHYDRIQEIWNDMYWAQNPRPEKDPSMNWSPVVPSPISDKEAKIIHFHSSRSPQDALRAMAGRVALCV